MSQVDTYLKHIYIDGIMPDKLPKVYSNSSFNLNFKHHQIIKHFRSDYNGRPCAYQIEDGEFLLRTHPWYCFEYPHYGRIYHYTHIKNGKLEDDIEIYVYDWAAKFSFNFVELVTQLQQNNIIYLYIACLGACRLCCTGEKT